MTKPNWWSTCKLYKVSVDDWNSTFLHLSRFLSGLCSLACKFLRTLLPWSFLPFDKVTAFKQLSFLSFIARFTQLVESAALIPVILRIKNSDHNQ